MIDNAPAGHPVVAGQVGEHLVEALVVDQTVVGRHDGLPVAGHLAEQRLVQGGDADCPRPAARPGSLPAMGFAPAGTADERSTNGRRVVLVTGPSRGGSAFTTG